MRVKMIAVRDDDDVRKFNEFVDGKHVVTVEFIKISSCNYAIVHWS